MVSPAYHFDSFCVAFHSVDGTRPTSSFGRSMFDLHAEAEQRRPLVDPVDTDHVADGVEVDVARLLDRVPQIDGAVAALLPALELVAVEIRAAGAVHLEVRRDDAFFEPGRPTAILNVEPGEYRPWRARFCSGCSSSRVQRRPCRAVDARGKRVRVVGGTAGEPSTLAVARIEHHRGAVEAADARTRPRSPSAGRRRSSAAGVGLRSDRACRAPGFRGRGC